MGFPVLRARQKGVFQVFTSCYSHLSGQVPLCVKPLRSIGGTQVRQQAAFTEERPQLQPDLPLPARVHQRVNERIRQTQQPQIVLQKPQQLTVLAQNLNRTHHEKGTPGHCEAPYQESHGPQGLDVAPVSIASLGEPGARLPGLTDLFLVEAGYLQDVQVEEEEDGEDGEERRAEHHHDSSRTDDGEERAEAAVGLLLEVLHHPCWKSEE